MFLLKMLEWIGRKKIIYNRENSAEYLHRYYIFRKPKMKKTDYDADENHSGFNIFLHNFKESDLPVLHDHPWSWGSLVIWSGYWEHLADGSRTWRGPGSFVWRSAETYHWVELEPGVSPWTIFFHGKRTRRWGFLYNDRWIYWKDFVNTYRQITRP